MALLAAALGVIAAISALAVWRGWNPGWGAAWRHAWSEGGYRAGAHWLDLTDWLRTGTRDRPGP
jgi:hypothetical protein